MNYDHAFVVTYGRSGSTLLQGILNTIQGAEIRGENGNALYGIYRSCVQLRQSKQFPQGNDKPSHPWYGAHNFDHDAYEQDLLDIFRARVMAPRQGRTITGFKEIRYQFMPYNELVGLLGFMRKHFPRTAIIVNTRKVEDVFASSTKAKHAITLAQIEKTDENLRRYVSEFPDDTFHVHYGEYAQDPEALRGLFDFLGAPFDIAALRGVLGEAHSVIPEK